ncbi:hypothetical protein BJ875DRAFT_439036 [Amylocarpus encephaloides]|uniref:Uncharacterized protein n=1 Tax=Amylocarpus encephaloides TaxID=45428 RepID=A0A9P8C7F9_9HELO|nr:hypothetical protein BJ875DRAFT_439036 [Amylocarpus encephaloides]
MAGTGKSQRVQLTRFSSRVAAIASDPTTLAVKVEISTPHSAYNANSTAASTTATVPTASSSIMTNLTTPGSTAATSEQETFPFFSFALEIREMVYKELLILPEGVKSYEAVFECVSREMYRAKSYVNTLFGQKFVEFKQRPDNRARVRYAAQELNKLTGFLLTSKKVYKEAHKIFYSGKSFHFNEFHDLHKFLITIGQYNRNCLSEVNFALYGRLRLPSLKLLAGCVKPKNIGIQVLGATVVEMHDKYNFLAAYGMNQFRKIRGCQLIIVTVIHNIECGIYTFKPAHIAHVTKVFNQYLCRPRKRIRGTKVSEEVNAHLRYEIAHFTRSMRAPRN